MRILQALHRPGVPEQCDSDQNGKPDHEQPPEGAKDARNKNVLVIGGSGSGKTRFWLKPNLMQMHSSYVVTDPKGNHFGGVRKMLERGAPKLERRKAHADKHGKVNEPYRIKVLNTINFRKVHALQPVRLHPQRKGHFETGQYADRQYQRRRQGRRRFWVKAERFCTAL